MPSEFESGFRPQSIRPVIKVVSLPLYPVRSTTAAQEESSYPVLIQQVKTDREKGVLDPRSVGILVCPSTSQREQNVLWSMTRREFEDTAAFTDYTDLSAAEWKRPDVVFPIKVGSGTNLVCAAGGGHA